MSKIINIPVNRCINRSELLVDSSLCGNICSTCKDNTSTSGTDNAENGTVFVPELDRPYNACCDHYCDCARLSDLEQKKPVVVEGRRVRIRYVGFIYKNCNYIIDLDNKIVVYKYMDEAYYKKMSNNTVHLHVEPVTYAYVININLVNENATAEIEVYPNDISRVCVMVTQLDTHHKEILDDAFTNYDYFSYRNMIDDKMNIITLTKYNDIFAMTLSDITEVFDLPTSGLFIQRFINDVYQNKDKPLTVINDLLQFIKTTRNDKLKAQSETSEEDDKIDDILNPNPENDG